MGGRALNKYASGSVFNRKANPERLHHDEEKNICMKEGSCGVK